MLVCHCNVLSDREIRQSIREGADSVEAVAARCGAGTCCGGCHPTIERLIRIERAPTSIAPGTAPRSAA